MEPPSIPNPPIDFQPCAGLANRLRALASAMRAAEDLGRPLRVYWTQEPNVYRGRFEELFDRGASRFPKGMRVYEDGSPGFTSYKQEMILTQEEWDSYARRIGPTQQKLNIKSYAQFYTKDGERWKGWLRALKPQAALAEKVRAALAPAAGRPVVGIHMRRGDNRHSVARSPYSLFEAAIAEALAADPTRVFFVASDSAAERDALKERFGTERILTLATTLSRRTMEGGHDAFLDFLALASCSEIWGSFHSSFSEIAAVYGGDIPHKVLKVPEPEPAA